jgi:uncharacterized protein YijF (DUF1287 family)
LTSDREGRGARRGGGALRALLAAAALAVFVSAARAETRAGFVARWLKAYRPNAASSAADETVFERRLSSAALAQTETLVVYDPSYVKLKYPGGDVPADRGVCTDVVIRAYRAIGVDLQVGVHEDMAARFAAYPSIYGRRSPDPNIDHRRVPNLMVFFGRKGKTLPITTDPKDYRAGDVVMWDITGDGLVHTGLVVDRKDPTGARPLIVHNIGQGPKLEDALFSFKIIGHFRYEPAAPARRP